jgi:hypothetical protein
MSGGENHNAVSNSKCLLRVNNGPDGPKIRLLLYPDQRTSSDRFDWSGSCQRPASENLHRTGKQPGLVQINQRRGGSVLVDDCLISVGVAA